MTYVFGVYELNSTSGELKKSGRAVALEPQPARALALLLERAGEIVTREELTMHVWGTDTHVDFNRGLAYCVGQIRAAIGDDGNNPRFVQTLPKRGFKWIAPVLVVETGPTESADLKVSTTTGVMPANVPTGVMPANVPTGVVPANVVPTFRSAYAGKLAIAATAIVLTAWAFVSSTGQRPGRPIVAVSAFDNETGESRYDRALGAVSDAVVDRLTGIGPDRIGVVGNASVLRIPRGRRDLQAIANQTAASHVILAQLQPKGGEVSLLMHLISLDDGTHLWTRRIARTAADSLDTIGDEAARTIEGGVRQHLLGQSAGRKD